MEVQGLEVAVRNEKMIVNRPQKPTIGGRLGYIWFAVMAVLITIPLSLCQVIAHQFDPTAQNFKRWSGAWGRLMLGVLGIRVHLEQRERLDPHAPYVFVSNHQNLLDILALAGWLPYPFGFVAKVELRHVPFLGFAIRNSASVFIDRSDPRKSLESLQKAGEKIRRGNSVLVYAEGTRSHGPALLPFKKGAFALALEAGVPIVPITIVDSYRLMDERNKTMRPGTIQIVIGTPLATDGMRRRDIPNVMEEIRSRIESELPHQVD